MHDNLCITYYLLRDPEGVRKQAGKKLSARGDSLPFSHEEELLEVWAQVSSGDVSAGAAVSFEWLESLNIKPGRTIEAPVLLVATAEIMAAKDEFPEAMEPVAELGGSGDK